MGQGLSAEEGFSTPRGAEESGKQNARKHHDHTFFLSNSNMETMGDINSLLEAINVSPNTPLSDGNGLSTKFIPRSGRASRRSD